MSSFDLVIRGGTVVTAADRFPADIGVRDEALDRGEVDLPRVRVRRQAGSGALPSLRGAEPASVVAPKVPAAPLRLKALPR